jgi:hypothetical protein
METPVGGQQRGGYGCCFSRVDLLQRKREEPLRHPLYSQVSHDKARDTGVQRPVYVVKAVGPSLLEDLPQEALELF